MNDEFKFYLIGFLIPIVLILFFMFAITTYQLFKDLNNKTDYVEKFNHIDSNENSNIMIYEPITDVPFRNECIIGANWCNFQYADVNGNSLYSEKFIPENSTRYVHCDCRIQIIDVQNYLLNFLRFNAFGEI